MRATTAPTRTHRDEELALALQLIAHGTADEKVRYIAERDPDYFVDHVLDWSVDYVDRDEVEARPRPTDRAVLDRVIARIAVREAPVATVRGAAA
jgi:hypothetical protein